MTRKPLILVFAVVAAGACLLFGMALVLTQGGGELNSTAAGQHTSLRWFAAIGAGFLAGIIGWMVIAARDTDSSESTAGMQCRCLSCGGAVLDDWRLCPHCGAGLVGADRDSVAC